MSKEHAYQINVIWTGNKGQGTKDYRSYDRSHSIVGEGKQDLLCSSDPAFRGDPKKWNPEELLLASLSSCHMLWYLHLCADHHITVIEYHDQASAKMRIENSGAGYFEEAILHPQVVIMDPSQVTMAKELHISAHEKCFIANSVKFAVLVHPTIRLLG